AVGRPDRGPVPALQRGWVRVTVAVARFARCGVTAGDDVNSLRVFHPASGFEQRAQEAAELLSDPRTALVGALLEALEIDEPAEIELGSEIPYGSGLGGSSALAVCLM